MKKPRTVYKDRSVLLFRLVCFAITIAFSFHHQLFAQATCAGALDNTVTAYGHAGGVHANGIVYNWGLNMNGQLGDNTTTYRSYAVEVRSGQYAGLHPGSVYLGDAAGDEVAQLSSADIASGALMKTGVVYTWGGNPARELGNSTIAAGANSSTPVRVMKGAYPGTTYLGDDPSNPIISLFSGAGMFFAIAQDGMVYAWGSGTQARLGQGGSDLTDKSVPVKVLAGAYSSTYTYLGEDPSNKVTKVCCGYRGAMVLTSQGHLYAWGSQGIQGDGTTTQQQNTPIRVRSGAYNGTTYLGDNTANPIIAIAMGGSNGFAVDNSGVVYAWGVTNSGSMSNDRGQMGQNTIGGTASVPVKVLKGQYSGTTYLGDSPTNKILKIASNDHNIMTIAQDGLVYSWGFNDMGQLGDGTNTNRSTPIKVLKAGNYPGTTYLGDNPLYPVVAVAGGANGSGTAFSLYLTGGDCRVYGSGYNGNGELGDGTTANRNSPVSTQVSRACGAHFGFGELGQSSGSVMMMINGILYSWGNNSNGQLGIGNTTNQNTPVRVLKGQYTGIAYLGDDQQTPTNPVVASAEGSAFSLALTQYGEVYAFGLNSNGQLGDNSTTQRTTPVRVLKGQSPGTTYVGDDTASSRVIDMDAGATHSFVLSSNGKVYGWGNNANGQLGDNTTTQRNTPVAVLKGQYNGVTYLGDNPTDKLLYVSSGASSSAAIGQDGLVYTWGLNTNGQLGNNSTTQSSTPVKVRAGQYPGTTYLGDVATNKIVALYAAGSGFYAIDNAGVAYAWGLNSTGQLGDNTTTQRSTPVKVLKGQYGSGTTYLGDLATNKVVKIAAGTGFALALAQDGLVYAWGANSNGQLGDNSTTQRNTPIKVLKGSSYSGTTYFGDNPLAQVTDIAALTNTSLFATNDCAIYGMGDNSTGQLGNGTTTSSSTPTRSSSPLVDFSLPVEMVYFEATQKATDVVLRWETASEMHCYAMEVERRIGKDATWERIGAPLQGHGTTNQPHTYNAVDGIADLVSKARPSVPLFYRVKTIDFDGATTYSEMREVTATIAGDSQDLSLEQNMPNPFYESTSIGYVVNEFAHVRLTIHDVSGRMLATLVDADREPGRYVQSIDGRQFAPGIYQYVLRINTQNYTKQMIVVK